MCKKGAPVGSSFHHHSPCKNGPEWPPIVLSSVLGQSVRCATKILILPIIYRISQKPSRPQTRFRKTAIQKVRVLGHPVQYIDIVNVKVALYAPHALKIKDLLGCDEFCSSFWIWVWPPSPLKKSCNIGKEGHLLTRIDCEIYDRQIGHLRMTY